MFRVFLQDIPALFLRCWEKRNLLWHLVAAVSTYGLVSFGFDWWYFEHTRNTFLHPIVYAAGIGGFFVPVLIPVGLFIYGELRASAEYTAAAAATAKAVILASIIAIIYKALTGRIQPEFLTNTSLVDISRSFNFGFLEHGVFWGWPSSHTAVAVALCVALMLSFPESRLVKYASALYMLVIAVGASIGFHWFSDVLAGALIGMMIGIVTSTHMRKDDVEFKDMDIKDTISLPKYILYVKTGCPYCARVLSYAEKNGITFELRNRDDVGVVDELIARGGKRQFPYFVDSEKGIEMYESEDIVEYLTKRHA